MVKLIRDCKVAVLVSHGFGAGWYTWNTGLNNSEEMLFDPDIADAILDGRLEKAELIAETKYPGAYHGGVSNLKVEWVPVGTRFEIDEYDGAESLRILSPSDGLVA